MSTELESPKSFSEFQFLAKNSYGITCRQYLVEWEPGFVPLLCSNFNATSRFTFNGRGTWSFFSVRSNMFDFYSTVWHSQRSSEAKGRGNVTNAFFILDWKLYFYSTVDWTHLKNEKNIFNWKVYTWWQWLLPLRGHVALRDHDIALL